MYYLCEKDYKPITGQYYIVCCVSWVRRLTLLDLKINWTYEYAFPTDLVCMLGTDCRNVPVVIIVSVYGCRRLTSTVRSF